MDEGDAKATAGEMDEGDTAFHRVVIANMQEAQARARAATETMDLWYRHVTSRYSLAPDDLVKADGAIVRAPDKEG